MNSHGGKRTGSGRPRGGITGKQLKAIDLASQILEEIDQLKLWKRLLADNDPRIVKDCLVYLIDRVHGRPRQRLDHDVSERTLEQILEASWGRRGCVTARCRGHNRSMAC